MLQFLVRRTLWAAFLFLAATILTYIIFFVIPADPAALSAGKAATTEDVVRVRHFLHLDEPVWKQYGRFLWNLVYHRDLGKSFHNRQSVNTIVGRAAPVSASIVLGGAFFWMLVAMPIGILSALRPRSLIDRAGMIFVLIGISAHPVWIGLILGYLFGFKFGLTPITGYCDFINPSEAAECGGPVQWAYHLLLPWATFTLLFAALYVRMIRATVMETMNEDYVRTARAKGSPEGRVLRAHILRNAMLPVVTILGMDVGLALSNAIFTETVFGLPGLGRTIIQAYDNVDLPVIIGIVVFASTVIIFMNLVVDMLYAVLDPRIRLS